MDSIKLLNSAINSIFPRKYNEAILKQYFTYEYLFLAGASSLNKRKAPQNIKLTLFHVENYFPFPMLLTRCIWKAFSYKPKEHTLTLTSSLSIDEYVNGFLIIYTGSIESRIRLVFNLFNVNKDNYAHIEDVRCILTYIHIYSNKQQLTLLNDTINAFFGTHKMFDEENFVLRTLKKHSGVFLIMMSILSELKTFSHEILALMGDSSCCNNYNNPSSPSPSMKSNILMKRLQSKFKMKDNNNNIIPHKDLYSKDIICLNYSSNYNKYNNNNDNNSFFPKYHTNIGMSYKHKYKDKDKFIIGDIIVDYIQANYNSEFTFSFVHSQHASNNNSHSPHNITHDNIDSLCDSSISNNVNQHLISNSNCMHIVSSISNDDCSINNYDFDLNDINELNMFENDLKYLRYITLEHNNEEHKYQIPKGSNDFILKSGVIEFIGMSSNNISHRSKYSTGSGMNKSFNLSMLGGGGDSTRIMNNNQCGRQGSPNKSSFIKSHSGKFSNLIKKDNEHFGSSPSRDRCEVNNNNNNNSVNFSLISDQSSLVFNSPEIFEEEVSLMKNERTLKKYTLILVKGFLVFTKKKTIDLTNLHDKDLFTREIKKLIPLKRLFIIETTNLIVSARNYHILTIGSTIQYEKRQYQLYFETKAHVTSLASLILTETNYISVSKEYTYIKDIGKGSFCQMKLMRHNKTKKLFAVKQMTKNVTSLEEFNTQNWEKDIILFLKNFNKCEHILKFYNIYETYYHIYIISEYIESGSLSKYLSKMQSKLLPSSVNKIALHVSKGLKELHKYGIIHRDIKLENIVMNVNDKGEFTAKVIDFGLSTVITPLSRTKEPYGTLIYCSPEIMLNIPYNAKVDVWSLGIIVFYLLFTFMPFGIKGNENEQEISKKIIVNNLSFPKIIPDNVCNEKEMKVYKVLMKVIMRMLYKDIESRWYMEDVEHNLSVVAN